MKKYPQSQPDTRGLTTKALGQEAKTNIGMFVNVCYMSKNKKNQ